MTGRRWLRRDVLMPIVYLILFGAALYWLYGFLNRQSVLDADFVQTVLIIIGVIYALLILITIRHVLSTYDLERYDPGNPESLKRLMKRRRFRLSRIPVREDQLLVAIEQELLNHKYQIETASLEIGRVYQRRLSLAGILNRRACERVILLQHEPLNVLIVDQLIKDCIRHIRSRADCPSKRNILILLTRMTETQDAASAAAGIVNFLGKFKGGTLCPILLATRQFRLFHPVDRTLLPRTHRCFQNIMLFRLRKLIRNHQTENKR